MLQEFFSNINIHLHYGAKTTCNANWRGINEICTYHKLYYILSGSCVIEMGGTKYTGKKGQLFFIPARTRHSFYHENEDYVTKHWIHFSFDANTQDPFADRKLPAFVTVDQPGVMDRAFRIAYRRAQSLSDLLLQKAKILEILGTFLRLSGCEEGQTEDPVRGAMGYIHTHLQENITVAQLAQIAHLHPNYFIRMFKQTVGMPPLRYVTLAKIERGKMLLEQTELPVSDIAASLGYSDPAHFSRVFKSICGYSPRQFRQRFS